MRPICWRVLGLICACSFWCAPAAAQNAVCGVVDALDYPLDIRDTINNRYDDFGLYRQRFGGRHTGLDVAFNRHYDPVQASARGRVTYSDPEGWDTEKGVVVVQHIFPDGSTIYTLYGHMEQTEDIQFPAVGTCVERGDVVGVVGWPSRGAPHLHYEIRNFLPDDGGPGYVADNPLLDGWFDPLDFTELWQIRLAPGYARSFSFSDVPTLPPVILDDSTSVIAASDAIVSFAADGRQLWRVATDGIVTALIDAGDGAVLAHTRSGQALVVRGGRYTALWNVAGPDAPVVAVGEARTFVSADGGLAAYDRTGQALWSLAGEPSFSGVIDFQGNGREAALAVRTANGAAWRVVDANGKVIFETTFAGTPLIAPIRDGGGWLVLAGGTLYRVSAGAQQKVAEIDLTPGRTARLTADVLGNAYLYLGDWDATLLAISADGQRRWQVAHPSGLAVVAPLLRTDNGCLLYTLDERGALHVFDAASGELADERQLYAGGVRNGSPNGRLLVTQSDNRVTVGAGFLSAVVLDGAALGNGRLEQCVLG